MKDKDKVGGSGDLTRFAAALDESLSLQRRASSIGSLGIEQHAIGGFAQEMISDAAVATRDLVGELFRESGHFESNAMTSSFSCGKGP
jgi:hypothetical protein